MEYLQGKTWVLVTHSIQYLPKADRIIYMDKGQIKFNGNFNEFYETHFY